MVTIFLKAADFVLRFIRRLTDAANFHIIAAVSHPHMDRFTHMAVHEGFPEWGIDGNQALQRIAPDRRTLRGN